MPKTTSLAADMCGAKDDMALRYLAETCTRSCCVRRAQRRVGGCPELHLPMSLSGTITLCPPSPPLIITTTTTSAPTPATSFICTATSLEHRTPPFQCFPIQNSGVSHFSTHPLDLFRFQSSHCSSLASSWSSVELAPPPHSNSHPKPFVAGRRWTTPPSLADRALDLHHQATRTNRLLTPQALNGPRELIALHSEHL